MRRRPERRAAAARRRWLLALPLGGALLAGCGGGGRPNVLLVTLDTTRPDHLGTYGYSRPTSPHLDALARESVRFERAYSHVPITLPAHTSLMTGTVPLFHGARDNGRFTVREEVTTLAEVLRAAGYRTAAFVSAFVLDSRYGLDQGFELYDDDYSADWSEEDVREVRVYNTMITERRADQTTDRALAWLAEVGDGPYFAWVHYYDPHQRYRPPAPYDSLFGGEPYDGEIAFMDSQVGRLLAAVRERGDWDETLIVAASDHGESLGQHGEQTHAVLAYDTTLRVALMIKPPAAAGISPGVDERPVSHRDVLPTVTGLLGLAAPTAVQGEPLLPDGGGRRERPIYFECHLPRFGYGWEPLFGVRTGQWKYIHAPERELYRIAEDPQELVNVAAREETVRDQFEALLFRTIADSSAPPEVLGSGGSLDPEARARLAALGYVSTSTVAASELTPRQPTGRRNPRQGVAILQDYFAATSLAGRGQLAQAAALYERVLLALDPENPAFLTSLGDLRRQLGDHEGALAVYRRAQALDAENPSILVELGRLEMDRGNLDAAEELLGAARQLAADDLAAAYFHGRVASARGEHEEAVRRFEEALAIDPSHRDSRLQIAIELGRLDRLEEARQRLAGMLDTWPFSAQVHYNLGVVALRLDDPDGAVAALERAVSYRAVYPEARFALGVARRRAGDEAAARGEFERLLADFPDSELAARARAALAGSDGGG